MKSKLLKFGEWYLQLIAEIIYYKLTTAKTDEEFNFWMFYGLWLDSWCVDRNIWLE